MRSSKLILLINTIFCLIFQINSEKHIFTNHTYSPNATVILHYAVNVGYDYMFAECYGKEDSIEKNCTIVSNVKHNSKTCNVTVRSKTDGKIDAAVNFVPLDISEKRNRGVLVMIERSIKSVIKLIIVDFHENNCLIKETDVFIPEEDLLSPVNHHAEDFQIIPYGDSFDFVYKNSEVCKNKVCRLTINSDGAVVDGPHPWFSLDKYYDHELYTADILIPIEHGWFHRPSSKGYLLIKIYFDNIKHKYISASVVNQDGEMKELKKISDPALKVFPFFGYSLSHKTIGVCFPIFEESSNTTLISCAQFDKDGKSKLLEKSLKFYKKMYIGSMHNLKGGGFLLTTLEYLSSKIRYDYENLYVTKVDGKGNIIGSMEIKGFKNKITSIITPFPSKQWSFFENQLHKVCISETCIQSRYSDMNMGHFVTSYMCLEDSDFVGDLLKVDIL